MYNTVYIKYNIKKFVHIWNLLITGNDNSSFPFSLMAKTLLFNAHYEKTDLMVFVVVIPKKDGRAWLCPTFFWYDTDFLRI